MESDQTNLFIEINKNNYIFVATVYDENQNLIVKEKIITSSEGIDRNKFTNIDLASEVIKKNVGIIEKKINYIFKNVTLVIEDFNYSCINLSGFKKLNGSQVLKENISYILNSLKLSVNDIEKKKNYFAYF